MDETEVLEGRYRLGALIGRGGAADVHIAHDLRLGRQVAVKRYRASRYGVGLRRFMAEGELVAGLSHPGLITVFDIGFADGRPYLVLAYAAGGTLRDRLDTGGPLWPDRVASLGAALADVLAYVHNHGIAHRDVKPSNVLFNTDGDPYLADFGIARALAATQVTSTDEITGTAGYLAPEAVLDRGPGAGVDVYALGLVLLECLTGEPEYPGAGPETAAALLSRPPRIPGTWGPAWRAVLTAMTAADPARRPSARASARMLRAVASGERRILPRPRRAHRVLGGLAALAVITGVAFASGTSSDNTIGVPPLSAAGTQLHLTHQ